MKDLIKDLYPDSDECKQKNQMKNCFTESMRNVADDYMEWHATYPKIDGIPLSEAPNEAIRNKIKSFLNMLTIRNMAKYYDCDIYEYFYRGDFSIESQLKFLWNLRGENGVEQWFQIKRLFNNAGFDILLIHADFLWSVCSETRFCSASWIPIKSDDVTWIRILISVILSDNIYNEFASDCIAINKSVSKLMFNLEYITVNKLGLQSNIRNALYRGGYHTLCDLIKAEPSKLLKTRCIGSKSLETINEALDKYLTENFDTTKTELRSKLGLYDQ